METTIENLQLSGFIAGRQDLNMEISRKMNHE